MTPKTQKRLNEALAKINQEYRKWKVNCVEYYESFTPNKWQEVHDDLERALNEQDQVLVLNRIIIFENTIIKLIRDYHRIYQQQKFNFEGQL